MPCEYLNCILCLLLQLPYYRSECKLTPFLSCFNNSSLLNLEGGEAGIVHTPVVQNCSGRDNKVWPLMLKEKCLTVRVSLVFWKALHFIHWLNLCFFVSLFQMDEKYEQCPRKHLFKFKEKHTSFSQLLSSGKDAFQVINITRYSVPKTLSFRP